MTVTRIREHQTKWLEHAERNRKRSYDKTTKEMERTVFDTIGIFFMGAELDRSV
jgi:hypothetical protein